MLYMLHYIVTKKTFPPKSLKVTAIVKYVFLVLMFLMPFSLFDPELTRVDVPRNLIIFALASAYWFLLRDKRG